MNVLTLAQAAMPPTTGGVDWLAVLSQHVFDLVTRTSGTLEGFGWFELTVFGVVGLLTITLRWGALQMDMFHHSHLNISDVVMYLLRLLVTACLMHYYSIPIPGTSLSLHQLFPAIGIEITKHIDTAAVDSLIDVMKTASVEMEQPSIWNPMAYWVYLVIPIVMGVIYLALFLMNAMGLVLMGVCSLFGPILIPFLCTKHFQSKFYNWVDAMLSASMLMAVGAGFNYVFGLTILDFFNIAIAGRYTIAQFFGCLAEMIALTFTFLICIFKVPALTTMLFGGSAQLLGHLSDTVSSFVRRTL